MNHLAGHDDRPAEPSAGYRGRRAFLHRIGLGGMLAGLAAFGVQSLRSLVPNVLFEPPMLFKIGAPATLADGVTFFEDRRLYIMKERNTFSAVSAACPHLGCTVKLTKLQQAKRVEIDGEEKIVPFEFHCPCHGSKFYADGTNYDGPAPRPLRWFRLAVSPDDGQLVVDLREEVDRNVRLTV